MKENRQQYVDDLEMFRNNPCYTQFVGTITKKGKA